MSTIDSPDIQAIFAQLHVLGVTPEQAAAGVRRLTYGQTFEVGETVRLARAVDIDSRGEPCGWPRDWDHHIGEDVTVDGTDYDTGDGMTVRIETGDGKVAWVSHEALDRLEPTT